MALFDKTIVARIAIATMIVLPPVVGFQRLQTAQERAQQAEKQAEVARQFAGAVAQERIDRTIQSCLQYNDLRTASIARSEAIIRISVSTNQPLTLRDQLLLADFVKRADKQIESISKPKVCTISALHLQGLLGIVRAAQATSTGGDGPSGSGVVRPATPASTRPGRPTSTPTTRRARGRPPTPTTFAGCQQTNQPGASDCHRHNPKPP